MELIEQGVTVQGGMFKPSDPGNPSWGYSTAAGGRRNGRFSTSVNWPRGFTARVLVDGYLPMPVVARAPAEDVERMEVTLRLKRGRAISGTILDHTGKPVNGAAVFAVSSDSMNVHSGQAWGSHQQRRSISGFRAN